MPHIREVLFVLEEDIALWPNADPEVWIRNLSPRSKMADARFCGEKLSGSNKNW